MPACDFCSWKKMDPYKMYLCFFLTEYVFRLVMWLWVAESFSRVTQTTQGWWKSWNAGEKPWGRIPRGVSVVLRVQCLPPEMWAYIWVLSLLTSPTAHCKLLRGRAVSQASGWSVRRRGSEMTELSTGSSRTLRREQLGVSARNTKIRSSFRRI